MAASISWLVGKSSLLQWRASTLRGAGVWARTVAHIHGVVDSVSAKTSTRKDRGIGKKPAAGGPDYRARSRSQYIGVFPQSISWRSAVGVTGFSAGVLWLRSCSRL